MTGLPAQLSQHSTTLLRQIQSWYDVQVLYIPKAILLRQRDADMNIDSKGESPVSKLRLYLPSKVAAQVECSEYLKDVEWQLQEAQANDALEGIRTGLRLRAVLDKRVRDGVSGVAASMRAQGAIKMCVQRIKRFATRYQVAYKAMSTLALLLQKGVDWEYRFKVLREEDIRPLPLGAAISDAITTYDRFILS